MKKLSMIISVLFLSTFLVAGSALALPINSNRPYTLGNSSEPSLQSILDSVFGTGVIDDYSDQSDKAVWEQDEAGNVDAYFITRYAGDAGVLGIYSYTDPTKMYDFTLVNNTASFYIDVNGALVSGSTNIAGFGNSFGFYWKDTTVANMSYTEDDKNSGGIVQALTYLIDDGTSVTLPDRNPGTAKDGNDWFLAFEDRLSGDFDFNDATFYVEDMKPVPEPATMLLLGFGLIGIAGASRKKLFKK